METKERKERLAQLTAEIARFDRTQSKLVIEFFELLTEDAKERLLNAEPAEIIRIQGEARNLDNITAKLIAATAIAG